MKRIISTSTAQNTMWHSQGTMPQDDLKGGREVRKIKSSGVPAVLGFKKLGNDHALQILNQPHRCCKGEKGSQTCQTARHEPIPPSASHINRQQNMAKQKGKCLFLDHIYANALTGTTGKACKHFSRTGLHFITSLDEQFIS